MLLLILREEFICIVILVFLIFYYVSNKVKDKEMLFLRLSIVALLHVVFDILTVITVNNLEIVPEWINRFLHICFYLTGILFAIWFDRVVVQMSARYRQMYVLHNLGYGLLGGFVLLLLFLPMEYVVGDGTNYSYGPLAFVGYFLFVFYCVAGMIMLWRSKDRVGERNKRALMPMLFVMCIMVIIQAIIPELLMTGGNITLICIAMFVALDNPDKDFVKQALWDVCTGLKNRNCYERDILRYEEEMKVKKKNITIGIVVADMNYLKLVNDNHGHAEGDKLLAAAGNALRMELKNAVNVYRLGGDEFVALYLNPNQEKVKQEMKNVVRYCMEEKSFAVPLSLAMGYASGGILDGVSKIVQEADSKMYEDKIRIKKENPHIISPR